MNIWLVHWKSYLASGNDLFTYHFKNDKCCKMQYQGLLNVLLNVVSKQFGLNAKEKTNLWRDT